MKTYNSGPKKSLAQSYNFDNFLEAFRDLGKSTVDDAKFHLKSAVTRDIPQEFGFPVKGGDLNPNEQVSLNDLQKARNEGRVEGKNESSKEFTSRLQVMQQEREALLRREESRNKQQIKSLQDEIRTLAKSMGEFAQEVEIATFQAPVNPGIYHSTFFSHLKSLIISLRKKVDSSKHWLAENNQRAKKQGAFWTQSKKSGTSYMLSSERYTVMSTG